MRAVGGMCSPRADAPAPEPSAKAVQVSGSLFMDDAGEPMLAHSAVLFVDLLGVREVSRNDPLAGLRGLEHATRRSFRDFLAPDSPWPSAFFSDTLVVASPFEVVEDEEFALGGLTIQAAYLQLNLIAHDWFLRGGLALGDVHIREGLVYGPALIDAYEVESTQALHPRIVLSPQAVESQRAALLAYGDPASSPENQLLLQDDDGLVFVDYLSLLLDDPDEDYPAALAMYRDRVTARLERHRGSRAVWEKYRWVAEYHNYTCARHIPDDGELLISSAAVSLGFHPFVEIPESE
jgi:hypothetical protein